MSLLWQVLVSIIAILPLPFWMAATNAAGHVTIMFVLVLQSIVAVPVFLVLFLVIAVRNGGQKLTIVGRWVVASGMMAGASILEWYCFAIFSWLCNLLFGSDQDAANLLFLAMMIVYLMLSITGSLVITHFLFRPSAEELTETQGMKQP